MLSMHVEPIENYCGLLRLKWMNLEVTLLTKSEIHVVKGARCNTNLHDCDDLNPLDNTNIRNVILKCIPLKDFCSVGGHSEMLCLGEQPYMNMSITFGNSKWNSKPTMQPHKGLHN